MNFRPQTKTLLAGTVYLLLWMTGTALAGESTPAEEMVKYRQSIMLSQRGHMAAAAAIIKGKVDFMAQLPTHVMSLEATTKEIAGLFPAGSDVGDTKAKAEVWINSEEFRKRAQDTQQKSTALANAVRDGDSTNYAQRLGDLLDSCKSCHKDFRKKEKN